MDRWYLVLPALLVALVPALVPRLLPWLRPKFAVHAPTGSAVLVTGTSSGIGRALAVRLVGLGYTVFGTVRKQADADELRQSLPERFVPLICDVADTQQVADALRSVRKHLDGVGRSGLKLAAVVNNAGIMFEVPGKEMESEKMQKLLAVNVLGPYRVAEAFMPLLLEAKGRLILVGSYFGSLTTARHAEYAATKHANEALADGLRRRFSASGVAVSLVKPGNIVSEMNKDRGESGPQVVEDAVVDALQSASPRERYYPGSVQGRSCWLMCHLFWSAPEALADKMF